MPEILVPFLSSSLGALIAGYLGVRFGVARLRRERAFDRRLEWYEKVVRTIHDVVTKGEMVFHIPDEATRQQFYQEMSGAVARFGALTAEAKLYCSKIGYHALSHALGELARIAPSFSSPDPAVAYQAQQESVEILLTASDALAADVRGQLGLEVLPAGTLRTIISVPTVGRVPPVEAV